MYKHTYIKNKRKESFLGSNINNYLIDKIIFSYPLMYYSITNLRVSFNTNENSFESLASLNNFSPFFCEKDTKKLDFITQRI